MSATGRTIGDELAWATRSLEEVGIDTARLDAEVLLGHALKLDRAALVLRSDERISGDLRTRYLALVARRASHEPVAYITAKRGFRHLELAVDPRVLIPRPETEGLVEAALELPQGIRVLDVGTGSGAVALALAAERPDLSVRGVDISEGAVAVARHNAERLRLPVTFAVADGLDDGEADAVVANLPYVEDGAALPPTVAAYEPARALFGGPDGLDVIRRLCTQVAGRPAITWLGLEIGAGQGAAAAELVRGAGFGDVEVRPDLAGHDRIVVGRR